MTETRHSALQSQVSHLLAMMGWEYLTVRRSIGKGRQWVTTTSVVGWPDMCPIWSARQPGRHLAVEVKIPPDKLRPEQVEVRASLEAAGFEYRVVTPDDLQSVADWLRPVASVDAASALPLAAMENPE